MRCEYCNTTLGLSDTYCLKCGAPNPSSAHNYPEENEDENDNIIFNDSPTENERIHLKNKTNKEYYCRKCGKPMIEKLVLSKSFSRENGEPLYQKHIYCPTPGILTYSHNLTILGTIIGWDTSARSAMYLYDKNGVKTVNFEEVSLLSLSFYIGNVQEEPFSS